MRTDRYAILLICLAGIAWIQLLAQGPALVVERQGDHLHFAAPRLHFLEGKPLQQLHDGASVTYEFNVALTVDQKSKASIREQKRFIVSFDLWEEKFSIIQEGGSGLAGSHLTAAMAEAWCLDNVTLPLPALPAEKSFVVKLQCRVVEKNGQSGSEGSSGLTLAGLVDVFSRKGRDTPPLWEAESAPLHLADLKERK
jgi:hypothetical protein